MLPVDKRCPGDVDYAVRSRHYVYITIVVYMARVWRSPLPALPLILTIPC